MSTGRLFTTNPLLIGDARGAGDVALSAAVVEIAQHFLEPCTEAEAIATGFAPGDLDMARKTGLVVPADSTSYHAARLWEDRGWSRAAFLMQTGRGPDPVEPRGRPDAASWHPTSLRQIALPPVDITSPVSLDALVRRRTQRSFADRPMGLDALAEVLLRQGRGPSWLHIFVVAQHVDGLDRGVYRYEPADHRLDLVRVGLDDTEALAAVNLQPWVTGSGACAFLVVQWECAYASDHRSRAYIDVLVEIGELAQEMLHAVYHVGAAAWGTPAVHETASRALLGIDEPGIDALYAVKFGPAPTNERAS
jgi:hypothetical protein